MMIDLEVVNTVNRCNVSEMQKVCQLLDPKMEDSCAKFGKHVITVQAALMHTYRIVTFVAVHEKNPAQAAALWKQMGEFCDHALGALKSLKERFPKCGTPELYDLALDYKIGSDERYQQNLRDSECQKQAIPAGLFPKKS